jgi:hypothetical protein
VELNAGVCVTHGRVEKWVRVIIIVQWNLKYKVEKFGVGSSGSEQLPVTGSYDHGNKPTGYVKCGEFFDRLTKYHLQKD